LDPRRYGFALASPPAEQYTSDALPPEPSCPADARLDPTGIFYASQRDADWHIDDVAAHLQQVYSGSIGYEFMHLPARSAFDECSRC
jgi:hypothetical protein